MSAVDAAQGLAHLKDVRDAEEEVLVIDFEKLSAVNAVVSNVSQWGCRLTSPDIKELFKNVGILPRDASIMVKAQVTSVKGNDAAVIFPKNEARLSEQRREKRNNVDIPVTIADQEGITEISGKIIDAGNNGCKIAAKGLSALPEMVLLNMKSFEHPVPAEFAWRTDGVAGLRILWHEIDNKEGPIGAEASGDAEVDA